MTLKVLFSSRPLTDADAARLKAEWAARMARPGAVMVLEPGQRFEAQRTWRTSCEGCGAAVQRHEMQCSYCLRSTGTGQPGSSPWRSVAWIRSSGEALWAL